MSWLQLEILESSPPIDSNDMIYRGAEIFVNTSAVRGIKQRQDGWFLFAMLDGTTFSACIVMEFQTLPPIWLRQNASLCDR